MKKSIIYIIPLLIAILSSACRKDEEVQIASLTCENLSISASYTTVSIEVDLCSNATIKEVVLEYTTDSAFSNHRNLRMGKFNKTERRYYANLDSLLDGTKYYYRFKAYNKVSSYTSAQGTFMTQKIVAPSMGGITVTNISYTTAECVANVVSDGGDAVKERGVCYATTENPTISNSKVTSGNGTGSFTCNLSGLTANTTFYVRAYATNNKGTIYSEQATFKTNTYGSPTVTMSSVTNITYTTATCGGNVTADGGQTVTARGVCYATIQNPTIFNSKVASGSGTGSFTCNLTGLTAGTTYYVRTYATNNKGTSYGTQVSFKTNSYGLPSVTTSAVTNISNSTAICGGNVTFDGGLTVTARGVCYATTQNPTTSNNKIASGSGTGSFTCNLTGLSLGTTYYVRAYATNNKGTSYGEQQKIVMKSVEFSVSATQKVRFSPGNLQFNATLGTHRCADGSTKTGTWRFAEKQYDIIGDNNSNISCSYNGWIDLFGWGTSGYEALPCDITYYSVQADLTGIYAYGDWGVYNAISNGGNMPRQWRTLSDSEWRYLIYDRPNASSLLRRAFIGLVPGYIILPDVWVEPDVIPTEVTGVYYWRTQYTEAQWNILEELGAIFLPAAGYYSVFYSGSLLNLREAQVMSSSSGWIYCHYWTSTFVYNSYAQYSDGSAACTCANNTNNQSYELSTGYGPRSNGCSVRLVQDINQ